MKNIKIIAFTSILIIIFSISAILLFGLTKNQDSAVEYYYFHEQSPLKITVTSDDDFTEICKQDGVFKVNEFENIPINETFCSEIFNSMKQLETKGVFAPKNDLEDYGLSDPKVTIKADFENYSTILKVGNINADRTAYYCLEGGKKEIGLIPSTRTDPFFREHSQYANLNLIPYSAKLLDQSNNLTSCKISKCVVERWDLKSPIDMAPDESAKLTIRSPAKFKLTEETRLQLENAPFTFSANTIYMAHPSDETIKSCGFNNPLAKVEYIINERKYSFKVGYVSNIPKGSSVSDEISTMYKNIIYKSYYVMMDDIPAIYTVSEANLPWLNMYFGN